MNLTSLDITLQRINMIENQFQSLISYGAKPDADFQKILDSSISNKKDSTETSRAEINESVPFFCKKEFVYYIIRIAFGAFTAEDADIQDATVFTS